MKLEFILIDFENIQLKNIGQLSGRPFKIKVFLGSHQARIPVEMAQAMQAFGSDAEYLQIDGNGSNALDFHIAYYIGRLSAEHPGSAFYIVSKDTGFDPLIRHLKSRGIACARLKSFSDIAAAKSHIFSSQSEKIDAVIKNFAKRPTGKPSTLKTLRSSIKTMFVNQLSDDDLEALIAQLAKRGTISVTDGKIDYSLP